MRLIHRHKGMLIGLFIVVALVVYMMANPLMTSQSNENLIQKMKVLQSIRLLVVIGIILFFWNGISRWIEARLSINNDRIADKRNRVLMWYVVIEAVFALGMYT